MAKRTSSPARDERALRRNDGESSARRPGIIAARRSAKVVKGHERRTPLVRNTPVRKREVKREVTNALPPPRIPTPPQLAPRSMELEWTGDPGGSSPPAEPAFERWIKRGDALLRQLAEHGASDHEVRADLREGRFCWVDPSGKVSAEARARLLCTFFSLTSSVTMGWADPEGRGASVEHVPGMAAEIDDIGEEDAWHVAMTTADHAGADYIHRVRSPSRCMFLALSGLTFAPSRASFVPATPVSLVLSTLGDARVAADLGAEPVDTLRARLSAAGASLLEQAEYAHRDTDWAFRLVRTGRRLGALAERLPRPTFYSVAKGASTVWLERQIAVDLVRSIALLEDEWRQFG